MDSGCFALPGEGRTVFAVKDFALAGLFGSSFEPSVHFHFELIEKDEFPAVCAVIFLQTARSAKFRYEYFFSLESEKDMRMMRTLALSKDAEMWFLRPDNSPHIRLVFLFDADEAAQIENVYKSAVNRA